MFQIIEDYVPQATHKVNNNPIWYNKKLINLRNIRNREYKKLQKNRTTNEAADDSTFIGARANFDNYQLELYSSYVEKIAQDRKCNPKAFWQFVNSKRSSNSLPSQLNYNGKSASSDTEKANLFAAFFSSVYINHDNQFNVRETIKNRNDHGCSVLQITEEAVFNVANSVNVSKGAGIDKIPLSFVRKCSEG